MLVHYIAFFWWQKASVEEDGVVLKGVISSVGVLLTTQEVKYLRYEFVIYFWILI